MANVLSDLFSSIGQLFGGAGQQGQQQQPQRQIQQDQQAAGVPRGARTGAFPITEERIGPLDLNALRAAMEGVKAQRFSRDERGQRNLQAISGILGSLRTDEQFDEQSRRKQEMLDMADQMRNAQLDLVMQKIQGQMLNNAEKKFKIGRGQREEASANVAAQTQELANIARLIESQSTKAEKEKVFQQFLPDIQDLIPDIDGPYEPSIGRRLLAQDRQIQNLLMQDRDLRDSVGFQAVQIRNQRQLSREDTPAPQGFERKKFIEDGNISTGLVRQEIERRASLKKKGQ